MNRPQFDRVMADLDQALADVPAPLFDDATVRAMVAAHLPTPEQDAAAMEAGTRRLLDALAEEDFTTDPQPLSGLALAIAGAAALGLLTLAAALIGAARVLRARPGGGEG